ncbi:MAG: cell division protein ZapA [Candidatus Latescibacterota bacterium]
MSETYKTTLVRILGEDYPLKSDADPEYMKRLAKYVEETVLNVTSKIKLPSHLKPEILAALLIADAYFTEKEKNAEVEQRLNGLISSLDETMNKELKE